MNVLVHTTYPNDVAKQTITIFSSTGVPKRPDSGKELGSMTYFDHSGGHTIVLFEVAEPKVGEFLHGFQRRLTYMAARIPGFRAELHTGLGIAEGITDAQGLLP